MTYDIFWFDAGLLRYYWFCVLGKIEENPMLVKNSSKDPLKINKNTIIFISPSRKNTLEV